MEGHAEELPARVFASLALYFDQTYHPEDWTPDFIEGDAPYCVGEESLFNEDILSTEKNSTSTSDVESLLQLQRSEIGVVADHLSLFALLTPTWTSEWASSKTPLDHKIYEAIKTVHNSTAGHAGVDRTCIRLVDQGVQWKGMRQAVRQFIKECPSCQLMSFIKIAVHTHPFTAGVYGPWERVNIDTIGPLPEDELGYKFIIVIIDCFSRFLELHPAKDATAAAAAEALYQTFGRFGSPQEILSDNGSQYVNEVITHFTEHIGVDHMLTMAYSHEENTIVERANKETMRHIRDIVFDRRVKNRWSVSTPLVQRIFNSNVISSIGVSPAQILFGNAISLDRGIFLPFAERPAGEVPTRLSSRIAQMINAQADVIEVARKTQSTKDHNHYARFPLERTTIEPGSYVLANYENDSKRSPNKLTPHLRGPFLVVNPSPCNPNVYAVQNLVSEKIEYFHLKNLRPFFHDPANSSPADIARKVLDYVEIDHIVSHKGSFKMRSKMLFLIRFKGFDASHDSYQTWRELSRTEALHKYLIAHQAQKHVPKPFRHLYVECL